MPDYKINKNTIALKTLYRQWANEEPDEINRIAESGSYRKYFRIIGKEKRAVGVFNQDIKENKAFISFTNHFLKKGLNVPEIYAHDLKKHIYLLQDLGDETLFSFSQKNSKSKVKKFYKSVLEYLIRFQTDGGKGLDFSLCHPRKKFDKQSILWDLNYFKYYFLKLAKIPFDEDKLERDYLAFTNLLLKADSNYFLYRDFQSRNILLYNNDLYFIDYQGGRKGALQYDVASLLFQAQINFLPSEREELMSDYLDKLSQKIKINKKDFLKSYYDFVLIRLLQTFGAYGFRGFVENKTYFLKSIPFAMQNLKWLLKNNLTPKSFIELNKVLNSIVYNDDFRKIKIEKAGKLKVKINSFSYKQGIPVDYTGNGGGFVFDCRVLNNPGRHSEYSNLTGKDKSVIRFLDNTNNVKEFLDSVYSLIDNSVENYNERKFKNLMINFGCTGGQHRSVYCAEKLADHLRQKFDVKIDLNHTALNRKD